MRRHLAFAALIVALVLVGWSSTTPGLATTAGTLVVGLVAEPTSMDPGQLNDINSMRVLANIYDTLVRFAPGTFDLQPGLATSWAISPDGIVYTFKLRKGVTFQDGTPVDAAAIKFVYDRLLDPAHPYHNTGPFPFATFYYGAIKETQVVDPSTVRFVLKQPFSPFLHNLTLNTGRIVSPAAVKKWGKEFAGHPVGPGPFKFVSWEKNVRIIVDKNPGYWDGGPKLNRLVFRPLVEEQTRVTELLSGGVDFIVDVPPDNLAQLKNDKRFQVYEQPGPHIWWVTLNTKKKPFNDPRVRQAANYAINKEAICRDVLKGTCTAAAGPIPPAITWAFSQQVKRYTYDPAKAKALLREAGYPNGFSASFWIPTSGSGMQSPKTMAEAIQADLAAVGIKASIQTYEWGAYLGQYSKGLASADMGAMSFMLDPGDPAPMLSLVIDGHASSPNGFNSGYYDNPKVNQLLQQATSTVDQAKRGALYRQVAAVVADDAPWIFIDNAVQTAAAVRRVQGFVLSPTFYLFFNDVSVQ